ncbi:MAG: hypothetical protein IPL53_12205 [Ignavibacteria bacterium]|nr:hypothetical protein [Ignavibacteria bacterium]
MKTKIVIFLVILVTIALRVYDIEQKNLWFDEVYSWKIAQGSIVQIVSETSGDIHPPFYYIILKFWMQIGYSQSRLTLFSIYNSSFIHTLLCIVNFIHRADPDYHILLFSKYRQEDFKRYLLYFLLVNILYIPWYPVFMQQVSKGQPWRKGQTIMEIGNSILDYFKDIFLSIYFNFESNAVFIFPYSSALS